MIFPAFSCILQLPYYLGCSVTIRSFEPTAFKRDILIDTGVKVGPQANSEGGQHPGSGRLSICIGNPPISNDRCQSRIRHPGVRYFFARFRPSCVPLCAPPSVLSYAPSCAFTYKNNARLDADPAATILSEHFDQSIVKNTDPKSPARGPARAVFVRLDIDRIRGSAGGIGSRSTRTLRFTAGGEKCTEFGH